MWGLLLSSKLPAVRPTLSSAFYALHATRLVLQLFSLSEYFHARSAAVEPLLNTAVKTHLRAALTQASSRLQFSRVKGTKGKRLRQGLLRSLSHLITTIPAYKGGHLVCTQQSHLQNNPPSHTHTHTQSTHTCTLKEKRWWRGLRLFRCCLYFIKYTTHRRACDQSTPADIQLWADECASIGMHRSALTRSGSYACIHRYTHAHVRTHTHTHTHRDISHPPCFSGLVLTW